MTYRLLTDLQYGDHAAIVPAGTVVTDFPPEAAAAALGLGWIEVVDAPPTRATKGGKG